MTPKLRSDEQPWRKSDRFDPAALPLADRHYNRQKIGSPQFVPPGRCLVLLADGPALWVTSWPFARYTKHRWAGAWVNSLFRREGGLLASDLVRAAVAATRDKWPAVPPLGMVTFINEDKIENHDNPGYCYLMAGFERDGYTQGGLLALRMRPERMPEPLAAVHSQATLWEAS